MSCIGVPEIKYRQFSETVHNNGGKKRLPINGAIELNFSCNLKCVHCYCPAQRKEEYLPLKEICRILDQIAEAGCLWLTLTGGEPLLRPDFKEIYLYAKRKGLLVTLFTNATLLDDATADLLQEYPPFAVEVSVYGATKETYERITRISGSFEQCLRGIEMLRKRGISIRLKTMAMQQNKHELKRLRELSENIGASFHFDPFLNPRLDGGKEPCGFRLHPEEILALDMEDDKRRKAWAEFCEKFPEPVKNEFMFSCSAGHSAFHIDACGKLCLCIIVREPAYDLREGSFKSGWEEFFPELLMRKKDLNCECAECELHDMCGNCPGWAMLEHGRPQKTVKFLCEVAHLRARAFAFGRYKKERMADSI